MMREQEVLVEQYLGYLGSVRKNDPSLGDEAEFAAWEAVEECIHRDPECAWEVLLSVLDRCDPAERYLVGTGALETFVFENVIAFSDRMEHQLRSNSAFFETFRFTYMGGVPERIWRHFNAVLAELGVPDNELHEWNWVDTERYPDS